MRDEVKPIAFGEWLKLSGGVIRGNVWSELTVEELAGIYGVVNPTVCNYGAGGIKFYIDPRFRQEDVQRRTEQANAWKLQKAECPFRCAVRDGAY